MFAPPPRGLPRRGLLLLAFFLLSGGTSRAQEDSLAIPADTLLAVPRAGVSDPLLDGIAAPSRSAETKSPWVAVGLSAALPGAGQVYTKNYWKVPVIWGLGGYWVYEWIKQNDKYRDFRDRYRQSITSTSPLGSDQLLGLRDFYRDQRDSFAWYMGFLYFFNLVDAYVGAHLYDFDVSPELTSDGRVSPRLRATLHIPLY
jgi:hypothetical protein